MHRVTLMPETALAPVQAVNAAALVLVQGAAQGLVPVAPVVQALAFRKTVAVTATEIANKPMKRGQDIAARV